MSASLLDALYFPAGVTLGIGVGYVFVICLEQWQRQGAASGSKARPVPAARSSGCPSPAAGVQFLEVRPAPSAGPSRGNSHSAC
jgi:hypothetical protein